MWPMQNNNEELKAEKREQEYAREQQALSAALQDQDSRFIQQQEDKNDLTRWQQDLDEELKEFVHDLRREQLVNGEWVPTQYVAGYNRDNEPVIQNLPPLVNELGIRKLISLLRPLLSRNLMMSNYTEDQIYVKLRRVTRTVIMDLAMNRFIYDARKEDLSVIVEMFKNAAEPAHWRAFNNGERNYLMTSNKRVESVTQSQNNEKKGWGLF